MQTRLGYETSNYPETIDQFREVEDGKKPSGKISAELVNKLYNALDKVEDHVRYACDSAVSAVGSIVVPITAAFKVKTPGRATNVFMVSVPIAVADRYFSGSPFNRAYGLLVYAALIRPSSSGPSYQLMEACASPPVEDRSLSCRVTCLKVNGLLRRDDMIVITLLLVIP